MNGLIEKNKYAKLDQLLQKKVRSIMQKYKSHHINSDGTVKNIIMPVNFKCHWFLIVISLSEHQVKYYDSAKTLNYPIKSKTKKICKYLNESKWVKDQIDEEANFRSAEMECPQQPNQHDCGAYTCLNITRVYQNTSTNLKLRDIITYQYSKSSIVLPFCFGKYQDYCA